MKSKFHLSFDPLGVNILFRGRKASSLRRLDYDLNTLAYYDIVSRDHIFCPERFGSIREERFLFSYFGLPLNEQHVIVFFFEHLMSKHSSFPHDFCQRTIYYDLLSLDFNIVCKQIRSAESFTRCFLYAYYAFVLKFYNPDFSFETLPF